MTNFENEGRGSLENVHKSAGEYINKKQQQQYIQAEKEKKKTVATSEKTTKKKKRSPILLFNTTKASQAALKTMPKKVAGTSFIGL